MKTIIYRILIGICILIVLINTFSFFNISFFGIRTFRVVSGSMEPYIHINDVVIIKKSKNYKVNDVITYKKNKEYITHRIVSIDNNEVVTKGDANNTIDDPIKKGDIVGKVIYKFKLFGFLCYLFSKPKTLILAFVFGLIITILIPDKKKGVKKYEEKKKIKKEIYCILFSLFSVINFILCNSNLF